MCERERERDEERRRNVSWLESRGVSLVCGGIRGEFEIMLRRAAVFPVGDTSDRIQIPVTAKCFHRANTNGQSFEIQIHEKKSRMQRPGSKGGGLY